MIRDLVGDETGARVFHFASGRQFLRSDVNKALN